LVLDKRYFVYDIYCNYKLTKASHTGRIKHKANPKVFELYHSGDSINGQNIVLKFVMFALAMFLALFLFFYFVVLNNQTVPEEEINSKNSLELSVTEQQKNGVTQQDKKLDDNLEDKDYSNLVFFELACGSKKCHNKDISIPPQLLKSFFIKNSVKMLHFEKVNDNLYNYYLETTQDFYNYIKPKQRLKNEKNQNDINGGASMFPTSSDTRK